MTRQPVNSTQLVSVGYNDALSVLEIEFQSGQIHDYYGVSASTYSQLMSAESIGSYFQNYIKGKYREAQVG